MEYSKLDDSGKRGMERERLEPSMDESLAIVLRASAKAQNRLCIVLKHLDSERYSHKFYSNGVISV